MTTLDKSSSCLHKGTGERFGRVTVRKLVGCDKDSLIGKAKAACASKTK